MATVYVSDFNLAGGGSFDLETFEAFNQKYSSELGSYVETLNEEEWYISDEEFDSGETDDKAVFLMRLLSTWSKSKNEEFHQDTPVVSFGVEGFSPEFYKDLYEIAGDISVSFNVTVSGQGEGYYSCTYEMNEDGWSGYGDYYED